MDYSGTLYHRESLLDWLQFLKYFFINVSYHIVYTVASLTLMALFLNRAIRVRLATVYSITH